MKKTINKTVSITVVAALMALAYIAGGLVDTKWFASQSDDQSDAVAASEAIMDVESGAPELATEATEPVHNELEGRKVYMIGLNYGYALTDEAAAYVVGFFEGKAKSALAVVIEGGDPYVDPKSGVTFVVLNKESHWPLISDGATIVSVEDERMYDLLKTRGDSYDPVFSRTLTTDDGIAMVYEQ